MSGSASWDSRVAAILRSVHREAAILMWLGFFVYGGGSAAIIYFMRGNPAIATLAIMFLFQMMVMFFGTRKMYPAIFGGFRTALEANRDSVPLFEKLADAAGKIETDPANHPLVKEIEIKIRQAVDEKIMPAVDTWARIGERLEKTTIPQFEKMVAQLQDSEKKIDAKVSSAIEGVKRVQQQIEGELSTGLLKEVREAAEALKLAGMQHAAPPMPSNGPVTSGAPQLGRPVKPAQGARDFSSVLNSLGKKSNGAPAPVAPQGGRS